MSNKKRRQRLVLDRQRKRDKRAAEAARSKLDSLGEQAAPVNHALLAPCNSYGEPEFARRGYYLDQHFTCKDCGAQEIWKATQQKWWYEVAKGFQYSAATRCRACRRKEQARKRAAREASARGKQAKLVKSRSRR